MRESRRIALCGMMAALSIVVLLTGALLQVGTYAGPMIAGILLLPVGREVGRKHHVLMWLAVSILSFILIRDWEQNLMYLCIFGVYPMLRPLFHRLKGWLRLAAKLLYFNVTTVLLEVLVMLLLVPESMGWGMIIMLLALGNLCFVLYDFILPRMEILLTSRLKGLLGSRR